MDQFELLFSPSVVCEENFKFRDTTGLGVALTNLANLFELVAKNRISPRRAAVFAYIGSLLLRTHSAIDSDREAGISDPTRPKPAQDLLPIPDPVLAAQFPVTSRP